MSSPINNPRGSFDEGIRQEFTATDAYKLNKLMGSKGERSVTSFSRKEAEQFKELTNKLIEHLSTNPNTTLAGTLYNKQQPVPISFSPELLQSIKHNAMQKVGETMLLSTARLYCSALYNARTRQSSGHTLISGLSDKTRLEMAKHLDGLAKGLKATSDSNIKPIRAQIEGLRNTVQMTTKWTPTLRNPLKTETDTVSGKKTKKGGASETDRNKAINEDQLLNDLRKINKGLNSLGSLSGTRIADHLSTSYLNISLTLSAIKNYMMSLGKTGSGVSTAYKELRAANQNKLTDLRTKLNNDVIDLDINLHDDASKKLVLKDAPALLDKLKALQKDLDKITNAKTAGINEEWIDTTIKDIETAQEAAQRASTEIMDQTGIDPTLTESPQEDPKSMFQQAGRVLESAGEALKSFVDSIAKKPAEGGSTPESAAATEADEERVPEDASQNAGRRRSYSGGQEGQPAVQPDNNAQKTPRTWAEYAKKTKEALFGKSAGQPTAAAEEKGALPTEQRKPSLPDGDAPWISGQQVRGQAEEEYLKETAPRKGTVDLAGGSIPNPFKDTVVPTATRATESSRSRSEKKPIEKNKGLFDQMNWPERENIKRGRHDGQSILFYKEPGENNLRFLKDEDGANIPAHTLLGKALLNPEINKNDTEGYTEV